MLATISATSSQIFLESFVADELVSISESGNEQSFQLQSGDTWMVPSTAGTSGDGTDTLTVDLDVVEAALSLRGSDSTDFVFATNISNSFFQIRGGDVTQESGTSVDLLNTSVTAESVRLAEPGNEFDLFFLEAAFADIRSENPIDVGDVFVDDGFIVSDQAIQIGGPAFFVPSLVASGQITIESRDSIDILSERIGVTGRLNLRAVNDIQIDSRNVDAGDSVGGPFNGDSELTRLNFQAGGDVNIAMSEVPPFGIAQASNLALVGENFAQNFSLNVETAILINAPGMTLDVESNADLTVHQIFMATNATDEIHVGRRAFIRAIPLTDDSGGTPNLVAASAVWIADAGDVRFGWLRSEDTTFVTLHEDDSTNLVRVGGNQSEIFDTELITIRSKGDIIVGGSAVIESRNGLNLEADGELFARAGDKTFKATQVNFVGERIRLDSIDAASVNFNSPGDVTLSTDGTFNLRGTNTGQAVRITAGNRINSIGDATLDARWMEMNSRSIWLANQGGRISVAGRANLFASDFIIAGRAGTVESGSLNFQTQFADLSFEGNIQLIGDNIASTAMLSATDNIVDSFDTRLDILSNVDFNARAVYLADSADDELVICGHANFNVTQFASVHINGTATIGSWRVVGASSWINPDSREC